MERTIFTVVRRTGLVASLLVWPLAAEAQNPARQPAQVQSERVQREQLLVEAVQTAQVQPGLDASATFLKPGQFVWHPEAAAGAGPVRIVVSIPLQLAYVFRGGTLIGASSVSTGLPGYDTPTGAFTILQKDVDHKSSLYDDAPMPYMQRLTWDGVALHAGKVTGAPASHGCVRLPLAFARKLFGETSLGAQVVVTDEAPTSPEDAYAMIVPATGGGAAFASAR